MNRSSLHHTDRWFRLYYVLAGFDILTIAFSLLLTHQIIQNYSASTRTNSEWVKRSELYEELIHLAPDLDAPGNDIFENHRIMESRIREAEGSQRFFNAFNLARSNMQSIQETEIRTKIKSQLDDVEKSAKRVVAHAERVFLSFENNNKLAAGTSMAAMDREYAELNRRLTNLISFVRGYQKDLLIQQQSESSSLAKFEYLIGAIVFSMIGLAVLYGHFMSRRVRKITSLIENQRIELENSSRLAALGTMSAGIAHEINNPLSVIQGKAQLLRDATSKDGVNAEKVISSCEKILATSHRITDIISGLRTFSRNGIGDDFRLVPLKQIFEDSVILCRERFKNHSVDLKINVPPTEMEIECRHVQICQIIVNLINNSYEAVNQMKNAWVELAYRQRDERIEILIKDSGSGISEEIADKIMLPFFTTKEVGKGTGMGLSIAHSLAQQNGGILYYDPSSPNTLFILDLPIMQRRPRESPNEKKIKAA